jgi:hypothetical protein
MAYNEVAADLGKQANEIAPMGSFAAAKPA